MFGCLLKGDFANENILAFCPNLLLLLGLRTLLLKCRSDSLIAGFGWLVTVNSMVRDGKSRFQLACVGLYKPSTNIPFGFVPCIFDPESISIDLSDYSVCTCFTLLVADLCFFCSYWQDC